MMMTTDTTGHVAVVPSAPVRWRARLLCKVPLRESDTWPPDTALLGVSSTVECRSCMRLLLALSASVNAMARAARTAEMECQQRGETLAWRVDDSRKELGLAIASMAERLAECADRLGLLSDTRQESMGQPPTRPLELVARVQEAVMQCLSGLQMGTLARRGEDAQQALSEWDRWRATWRKALP